MSASVCASGTSVVGGAVPAVHGHGDLVERDVPRPGEQRVVVDDAGRAVRERLGEQRERLARRAELVQHRAGRTRSSRSRPTTARCVGASARADVGDAQHDARATSGACSASHVSWRSLRERSFERRPRADLARAGDDLGELDPLARARPRPRARTARRPSSRAP